MDHNWFFSSVAQSAAAIVGIFAAFIITKIINNQSLFSSNNNEIKQLLNEAHRLEDAAKRRYFNWYNKHTLNAALKKLKEELKDPANDLLEASQYYSKFKFPLYLEKGNVIKIIETYIKNRGRTASHGRSSSSALGMYMPSISPIPNFGLDKALDEEEEKIEDLIDQIRHHNREIMAFLDSVKDNPESSTLISLSIVATILLFYAGVIYPLSFLPLEAGKEIVISFYSFFDILFSLRGGILAVISLVFTGIVLVFLRINLNLKYQKTGIDELLYYSKVGNYSPFLCTMVSNSANEVGAGDGAYEGADDVAVAVS